MERILKIAIFIIVGAIIFRMFAPIIVLVLIGLLIYLLATGQTKQFFFYVVRKVKQLLG